MREFSTSFIDTTLCNEAKIINYPLYFKDKHRRAGSAVLTKCCGMKHSSSLTNQQPTISIHPQSSKSIDLQSSTSLPSPISMNLECSSLTNLQTTSLMQYKLKNSLRPKILLNSSNSINSHCSANHKPTTTIRKSISLNEFTSSIIDGGDDSESCSSYQIWVPFQFAPGLVSRREVLLRKGKGRLQ